MAKRQTFTSKLGKEKTNFKFVKHIRTLVSEKTGHIKFLSRMLRIEENENIDQALEREEESSNISSFGEQPAEETQEEAPSEEPTEEAPAEESAPEEDSAEEAEESSKE